MLALMLDTSTNNPECRPYSCFIQAGKKPSAKARASTGSVANTAGAGAASGRGSVKAGSQRTSLVSMSRTLWLAGTDVSYTSVTARCASPSCVWRSEFGAVSVSFTLAFSMRHKEECNKLAWLQGMPGQAGHKRASAVLSRRCSAAS
jgi:hypothetical protein